MQKLEDYVEFVERLPEEFKNFKDTVKKLDADVNKNMAEVKKEADAFLKKCGGKYEKQELSPELNQEYQEIRKRYYDNLKSTDKKVNLANAMCDQVTQCFKTLDSELAKAKRELGADHQGVTEKKYLDINTSVLEAGQSDNRTKPVIYLKKKRDSARAESPELSLFEKFMKKRKQTMKHKTKPAATESVRAASPIIKQQKWSILEKTLNKTPKPRPRQNKGKLSYAFWREFGKDGDSIASVATQQMQPAPQASTSNGSYSIVKGIDLGRSAALGRSPALDTIREGMRFDRGPGLDTIGEGKGPERGPGNNSSSSAPIPLVPMVPTRIQNAQAAGMSTVVREGLQRYDPAPPMTSPYCYCKQRRQEDMIACDNKRCPIEWYHYSCVNIISAPKNKWYCNQCRMKMNKGRGRKNKQL